MVRLKAPFPALEEPCIVKFQYQYGAIKGLAQSMVKIIKIKFQYQYGAIKGDWDSRD